MNPKPTRRWTFLPVAAVGVLVFALMNRSGDGVGPTKVGEAARVLRVVEAKTTEVSPRAIGHGTSRPGQVWQAVAEVRGRIVEIHPDLASGAFIEKGAVLVRLDSLDYELAVASSRAAIEQLEAQKSELDAQEASTKASLEIEERSLQLAEDAFQRKRNLLERGAVSSDLVDAEERTLLAQRQNVQSLKNTLALIPAQRQSLEANINASRAQLARSERDLERVEVTAPFDCRLGPVALEPDQYLAAGQFLFEAFSTSSAEVEAQFTAQQLRPILSQFDFNGSTVRQSPAMDSLRTLIDVWASVRISGFADGEAWPARFDRIREAVDSQTRTIGIVVTVDDPYAKAIPGRRPPLTKGLFCEVELRTTKTIPAIVVPRSSLVGDFVYVLDEENRLEKRNVSRGFSQAGFVTIDSGIEPGDRVVVSEPVPAIEGMLVDPVIDTALMTCLQREALGHEVGR